ncbi:MAG: oxygen-independent coproporphyrinogen III oxidase [Magnetococcales bacterium]|nr:oxygen-independent coproporphyrinogen III oxidase [Magnetococcales bacterium]
MSSPATDQSVLFDRELIDRYAISGPRYTSYPTAPQFHEGFGPEDYRAEAARTNRETPDKPLSLYLHVPFCDTVCYYCACNKIVTTDRGRSEPYLDRLFQEIRMLGSLFDGARPVKQLHFGGGTPTYLSDVQLTRLMDVLAENFQLMYTGGEYGIEIDPREITPDTLRILGQRGFNRISLGVQDLDPKVQEAVNRIQPNALNIRAAEYARSSGFESLNVDLIYGLPFQTAEGFLKTLESVLSTLDPDRLAIFNYAHLPQYFTPQRRINDDDLPSPDEKLRILEGTITLLTEAGYLYVGMDHFAKPQDELAVAQRQGVLHRNFQGYTTHAECDLVAMGSTAISEVGDTYAQNVREIEEYYARIDAGELPIFRGLQLTRDDLIRREIIMRLICDFQLDRKVMGERLGVDFSDYFSAETPVIRRQIEEGLLMEEGDLLRVTPGGRLLIRNICMTFDWHLNNKQQTKTFSKTI